MKIKHGKEIFSNMFHLKYSFPNFGSLNHSVLSMNQFKLSAPWIDKRAPPGTDRDEASIFYLHSKRFSSSRFSSFLHHRNNSFSDYIKISGMNVIKDVLTNKLKKKTIT